MNQPFFLTLTQPSWNGYLLLFSPKKQLPRHNGLVVVNMLVDVLIFCNHACAAVANFCTARHERKDCFGCIKWKDAKNYGVEDESPLLFILAVTPPPFQFSRQVPQLFPKWASQYFHGFVKTQRLPNQTEMFEPSIVRSFIHVFARWHCNLKGLSQDGGPADFSKNLNASLFNNDLLNDEPNFGQIHLARQYF